MPCDDRGPRPRRKVLGMDKATQRAVARTGKRPLCSCLAPQYGNKRWRELKFHQEEQDTSCAAWKHLLELVERCAISGSKTFEPGAQFEWKDWINIITLPADDRSEERRVGKEC